MNKLEMRDALTAALIIVAYPPGPAHGALTEAQAESFRETTEKLDEVGPDTPDKIRAARLLTDAILGEGGFAPALRERAEEVLREARQIEGSETGRFSSSTSNISAPPNSEPSTSDDPGGGGAAETTSLPAKGRRTKL